jgi:hypothetical protein
MAQAAFLAQGLFGAAGALVEGESAGQNARAKEKELRRQQIRETEIAREAKSDRAREADIALGTLLATHADTGATGEAIARGAGEIAGIAGLDKARIESNRQEAVSALQSARIQNVRQARLQALSAGISMFASVAGGAGKAFQGSPATATKDPPKSTRTTQRGRGPQFTGSEIKSQGSF